VAHYLGVPARELSDAVWSDANSNGIQDDGEKGIEGMTVKLTLPDSSTKTTTTDANGKCLFTDLPTGTHTFEVVMASITKPSDGDPKLTTAGSFTIQLLTGQSNLDNDFGVLAVLPVAGVEAASITLMGLASLLAGALAVLMARRKEEDRASG